MTAGAWFIITPMLRPEKEKALQEKMERLGIQESDIVERFVRSAVMGDKTSTRWPPAST